MTNEAPKFSLGIDFGGVIIKPSVDDALIDPAAGLAVSQPGAIHAIAALVHHFNGQVYIVSKASRATAAAMRQWLAAVHFYQVTGLHAANIHICEKRADKIPIAQALNLSHFIDDNLDTLERMTGIVEHRLHFGGTAGSSSVAPAADWQQVLSIVGVSHHRAE